MPRGRLQIVRHVKDVAVNGRAAVFHLGNARAVDIEALNALLARLRQTFPFKPSAEIFAATSRAYAAGEPLARIFEMVRSECELGIGTSALHASLGDGGEQ
jgi:hypothetical protein